jgi:hypothetical protein
MSIVAFKRKSVIQYGSNVSGKPVNQYWLNQGPYGIQNSITSIGLKQGTISFGPDGSPGLRAGFSLKGSYPSFGAVGGNWKFSQVRTPFRGVYPIGHGGTRGRYPQSIVLADCDALTKGQGTYNLYVKPGDVSTKTMISQKHRWINSGQYPNYWVQPNYGTSNLSDNTSQGLYVQTKAAANDCIVDTNAYEKYVGHIVRGGSTGCRTTPAHGYTFNVQQSNAAYTKNLYIPQTASEHTLRIQQKCANPRPEQKPFPYATNGDTCNNTLYQLTRAPQDIAVYNKLKNQSI